MPIDPLWVNGHNDLMSTAPKKPKPRHSETKLSKSRLDIDGRGRITLPRELRLGIDSFSVEQLKDGALKLTPQHTVSADDASILRALKSAAADVKAGKIKKIPKTWLNNDDADL